MFSNLESVVEKSMAEIIGVHEDDMPMVRLYDTRTSLSKYKMDSPINKENIVEFIKQWENDTLVPYIKSDKLPKNQTGSVKIIVSQIFNETVYDESKDVVVFFCNQINEKCREANSTYELFAKKALQTSNETLLVTYIDNRLNELELFKVNKVPHIIIFPSGNKMNPAEFKDEDFSYDNIADFVAKNSNKKNAFKTDL